MQVVCQDGTIFQCAEFEAIDSGVLLFEEAAGEESEAEGEDEDDDEFEEEHSAIGFVPIQQIRYVVSDALLEPGTGQQAAPPRSATGQAAPSQGGAPAQSAPPAGTHPQQGPAPRSMGQPQPGTGYGPTDQQPQNR